MWFRCFCFNCDWFPSFTGPEGLPTWLDCFWTLVLSPFLQHYPELERCIEYLSDSWGTSTNSSYLLDTFFQLCMIKYRVKSLYTGPGGPWSRYSTPVFLAWSGWEWMGWDASPSQGYPRHICWYPFVHLGKEKHCEREVSCLRTQHNDPSQGSNPDHPIRSRAH